MVPMAIAWKWIFDARIGILNYLLSWFGIAPVGWLTSPDVAMWSIIIMSVWKVLGYNMILLLVGLKNIPASLLRGGSIDGAVGWRMFRRITLPLLQPILLFVIVISTINAYNVFTQVYVMTQGSQAAPGAPLRVLVFDIYQNGFQFFKMGYASAEAVVLTLIILALTLIQFRGHPRRRGSVSAMAERTRPRNVVAAGRCAAPDARHPDRRLPRDDLPLPLDARHVLQAGGRDDAVAAAGCSRSTGLVDNYPRRPGGGALRPLLPQQRRGLGGRHDRGDRDVAARRLHLRQVPVPRQEDPVPRDPRLRHVPVRDLHDPALPHHEVVRLDQHLPGHRGAVPDHELRHLPDAAAHRPRHPRRAARRGPRGRRLRAARSSSGSSSRSARPPSARSASSPSSRPGPPSSGRCSWPSTRRTCS